MYSTSVKLSTAIPEAEDRIEQAEAAYYDLKDFAEEEYGEVEAAPDVVYSRLQQYDQAVMNFQGRIQMIEQTLEEWTGPMKENGQWSGDEFEIEMMSAIQVAQLEDRVGSAKAAMKQDVGVVPDDMPGERIVELLEECVVDEPDGIPARGDVPRLDGYPQAVMMWLTEKVTNLNAAGDPNFEPSGIEDDAVGSSSN